MSQPTIGSDGTFRLDWAGTALELLPERAAFWAEEATLFVADLHWGKDASFRAQGVPLPGGDLASELEVLTRLIERHDAQRLIVLGDLIHDRRSLVPRVVREVYDWRMRHDDLDLVLVRGNHDQKVRRMPVQWSLDELAGPLRIGPFDCVHEPDEAKGSDAALAGHLHPTAVLEGAGDHLRLPCFRLERNCLILPAFHRFSNGLKARRARHRRLFVVTDSRVLEI